MLMIMNIAMLLFLMQRPSHPPRPQHGKEGPRSLIIEKLKLDQEQVKAYELLIQKHRQDILGTNERIEEERYFLYNELTSSQYGNMDSVCAVIGALEAEIERIHYIHFQNIKKLCREDQIPLFNELSLELSNLFNAKPGPKKP